jgi:cold shock CspA family protein
MPEGTIKWYDDAKGFGFLARGPGEDDIWFHARDRTNGTDESRFLPGARVEFTEEIARGRAKACISRILDGAGPEPAPAGPEVPQYTMDDALAGLSESLLAAAEWLDIVRALAKNAGL